PQRPGRRQPGAELPRRRGQRRGAHRPRPNHVGPEHARLQRRPRQPERRLRGHGRLPLRRARPRPRAVGPRTHGDRSGRGRRLHPLAPPARYLIWPAGSRSPRPAGGPPPGGLANRNSAQRRSRYTRAARPAARRLGEMETRHRPVPAVRAVLRTLLIGSFLVLAVVAPVWVPAPVARALAPRATAARRDDDG